jgi:hypothetical protein
MGALRLFNPWLAIIKQANNNLTGHIYSVIIDITSGLKSSAAWVYSADINE